VRIATQRIPETLADGAPIFHEAPILQGPELAWQHELPEMPSYHHTDWTENVSNPKGVVQDGFEASSHPRADAVKLMPQLQVSSTADFSDAQWESLLAKWQLFDQIGVDRSLNLRLGRRCRSAMAGQAFTGAGSG
jgi:hypothetical protein